MQDSFNNVIYIQDALSWLENNLDKQYNCIYIDPPYNTGSTFSYNDKRNNWSDFMKPIVTKLHQVLSEDGIMFVSIDDNFLVELCSLTDDIFGKNNRISIMVTKQANRSNSKLVNVIHEYVVVYAKNKRKAKSMNIKRIHMENGQDLLNMQNKVKEVFTKEGKTKALDVLKQEINVYRNKYGYSNTSWIQNYRKIDGTGNIVYPKDLSVPGEPNKVELPEIGLTLEPLSTRKWSTKSKILKLHEQDKLIYLDDRPYEKHLLIDAADNIQSILPFYSRQGSEDLKRLGLNKIFDTAKPVNLIKYLIESVISDRDTISILDCFAGSGTTLCAAKLLSQQYDNVSFSCDLVQIHEEMNPTSAPYKIAKKLGIGSCIEEALKLRVSRFYENNCFDVDYEIVDVCGGVNL